MTLIKRCPTSFSKAVWLFTSVFAFSVLGGNDALELSVTTIEQGMPSNSHQVQSEFTRGEHWGLSSNEIQRVDMLRREFRRFLSDDRISPLEILGIHARTDADRKRYAQRWAQLMIEDAERVLAFQRAYDEAVQDLLGNKSLVDLAQLPRRHTGDMSLRPTDRLAVFVTMNCHACDVLFDRVARMSTHVAGIDVYALDLQQANERELHRWAQFRGIPPAAVQNKRITLNMDAGLLARVHPRAEKAPVLMLRRGDRLVPYSPWRLP
ncbi:MAG: TIGR03759 family integrating conjugative element protein [Gammaproteobacteria bacterium]|nr:TIGR03759 family integrating conjugative element protein [Gammaproteobacteria bacterium]